MAAPAGAYVPARHSRHNVQEEAEYRPPPHTLQAALEAAPVVFEYLPVPHGIHVASDEAPIVLECVPLGQAEQVEEEFAPVEIEKRPPMQGIHLVLPVSIAYFPGEH